MFTDVFLYHWSDIAPSKRPFDQAKARGIIKHAPRDQTAIQRALLLELGPWIYGWKWLSNDPVTDRTAPDEVLNGLVEWRRILEEIEATFENVPAPRSAIAMGFTEKLAGETLGVIHNVYVWLLPFIRAGRGPDEVRGLTQWFLESIGFNPFFVKLVVDDRITTPSAFLGSTESASNEFRSLSRGLSWFRDAYSPEIRKGSADSAAWMKIREEIIASFALVSDRNPLRFDAHQHYINGIERQRDPKRADAMAVALDACRASAAAGEPLTRERLTSWHRIALGYDEEPEEFATDYARNARMEADSALKSAFGQASSEKDDIALRASLAYLDVYFLQPFNDGNHRAARLALDHTLTRSGFGLHAAEPVFAVPLMRSRAGPLRALVVILESLIGVAHRLR